MLKPNGKEIDTEDYADGDKSWLCLKNYDNQQTLYTSLRYDSGGIINFAIEPGGSHQINVGDGQGNLCYQDGYPIGTDCPNSVRITEWSENCPIID